ncbi:MAG: PCRF domain-containing protein [Ilumatobacteraceae bacterium]
MIDRLATVEDGTPSWRRSSATPVADPARLRSMSKRYKDLTPLVEALREHRSRTADAETARELVNASAGDDRELWRAELTEAEADVARLEDTIRTLMLPTDPNDGRAVILEIRGGGRRGSQPVRPRSVRDVSRLGVDEGVEARGALARRQRPGRAQPDHLRRAW